MRLILASCLLSTIAMAQSPQLTLSFQTVQPIYPGSTVSVNVNLSGSAGQSIAGIQWNHASSVATTYGQAVAGTASTAATKSVYCGTDGTLCLSIGFNGTTVNSNVLGDGVVASVQATIPPTAPVGTQSLSLTSGGTLAASVAGTLVALTSAPLSFLVLSRCDTTGNGTTDASDVSSAYLQATGRQACTTGDVNGDGKCTIVDVVRVITAASGGACATQ